MKTFLPILSGAAFVVLIAGQSQAVNLLTSGDFETPGGFDVPGWAVEEFLSGSDEFIDSATVALGEDNNRFFVKPYETGRPLRPQQGNFDDSDLPAGNVGGKDFLTWQRNFGLTGTALPEQGDANEDTDVDADDLTIWRNNYGRNTARFSNARFTQVVDVPDVGPSDNVTYQFKGTSTFETNYSGLIQTLDPQSPHGAITSPTTTTFRMEFLDDSDNVIGSATPLDLKAEHISMGFPGAPLAHTPLELQAPAGTSKVRVIAEALDMAWNGDSVNQTPEVFGQDQSLFFDDLMLNTTADPGTQLLINGDVEDEVPDPFDFWEITENPDTLTQILRSQIATFANHTEAGSRGVWLSAFFGGASNINANWPSEGVDGTISQTVDIVGGATYVFSGWTKFEQNYSGGVDNIAAASPGLFAGQPSPTSTEITLEFLDASENVISSSTIDIKEDRATRCAGGANDEACGPAGDGWLEHILQVDAPANAVQARLIAKMIDGVFNIDPRQSAFFDDFSLDGPASGSIVSVPEPSSLACIVFSVLLLGGTRRVR